MGTSSSTIQVGRACNALLGDAPVGSEIFSLLLETSLSNVELERSIPLSSLRTMRHYYTKNFALLLFRCIEVLAKTLSSFRESPNATSIGAQEFQNALRLMRRMLPIAMEGGDTLCSENQTEDDRATDTILLPEAAGPVIKEIKATKRRTRFTHTFVRSFFVDNNACDDENPEELLSPLPGQFMPLGKFLGWLLVECCFVRGLTLNACVASSKRSQSHPCVDESFLWYPGVCGNSTTSASGRENATIHAVRYELIYTLNVFLSYPLFCSPGTRDTLFTEPLLNVEYVPLLPTLVASSLNAILSYVPFGALPYTSHLVGQEESVVRMSAWFIITVSCYPGAPVDVCSHPQNVPTSNDRARGGRDVDAMTGNNDEVSVTPVLPLPRQIIHSAREFFSEISAEEARHIVVRLQPIIGLKLYANRTYLPDSQRRFVTQDEFMMMLWKLIDLSSECFAAFGRERATLGYLLPLVDYAIDAKRDPQYFPHLQLVLFILLRLSELRTFCLLCNTPFRESIPFEFETFVGSYGDLLILMLCSFMMMQHNMIRPFHETCSAIISNLAPFITSVCPLASEKLSLVFVSVATRCLAYQLSLPDAAIPSVAVDVVTDQVVMFNIVEAVASVLQYHEVGAASLLFSLLGRKSLVREVAGSFVREGERDAFRVPFTSPFLIGTLKEAIAAVEESVAEALATGKDPVVAIRSTTLVGSLPTPHRIVVRRLQSTWKMEEWAIVTHWSSLYMHSPPGTFGDHKSIVMLRFV